MFGTTRPKKILLYFAALVAPMLALLLRVALERRYGHLPHYAIVVPVVLLVAILGDVWAGLLATASSALLFSHGVSSPTVQFNTADALGLAIFCIAGVCISVVAGFYHRNRRKSATYEKQRAVAERRDADARYRKLFNSIDEGFCTIEVLFDEHGKPNNWRYLEVNPAFERHTGLLHAKGKTIRDLVPFVEPRWLDIYGRIITSGEGTRFAEFSRALNQWFDLYAFRVGEPQQHKIAILLSNITERKRMEDALQESEARFRSFMDNSPAIAWMKDAQGRYVYLSKAYENLTGARLQDWRGKTDADVRPQQHIARTFREHDLAVLTTNQPLQAIVNSAKEDGTAITLLVTKFPFETANGERFVGGVGVDITERKTAEEKVRESEERLRLLGDNLPGSVVYQYSQDADGTPHILYVSAGVERLNGIKAEDMLTDATLFVRQIYPEQLVPPWLEDVETSARDLSVFEHEIQIQLPNGELRWMHVVSSPRRLPDGGVIWDGVETDITERKRAQEALLRSEKLAATGRLAATIAHEVNNPLGAAMNAVYLARTSPTQADEMLEIAERELQRAAHITQLTLGFFRESGNRQKVTAHDVVKEVLSVYATKLRNRNITVHYRHRCSSSSPREGCPDGCKQCQKYLCVNAGELRQVISNLLANGIDALSDGGTMYIRTSRSSDRVQLTMADNGYGIRTENLKRIFEPFFTTKEDFGTGLGLWVTQELVRKHNGVMKVRSSEGKGTVFRLTFPQRRSEDGVLLTASSGVA